MKANVLFGIGDLKYTNIPLPRLKSDEVLVKVKAPDVLESLPFAKNLEKTNTKVIF